MNRIQTAIRHLVDPRVTPDFTSKILQCLTRPPNPKLIRRYVLAAKPTLSIAPTTPGEPSDVEIYLSALCEEGLYTAWPYQRNFASAQKESLIHRILEFSLIRMFDFPLIHHILICRPSAKPKKKHCKQLLTYPFSANEQQVVTDFALSPPPSISSTSLSVLRELILVRLVHSGGYAEAIKLSKRWGGEGREVITGLVDVLPDVQKRLLALNLEEKEKEKEVPAAMMMSWESLDRSTASSSFMHASQMVGSTSSGMISSTYGSGLVSASGSGLLAPSSGPRMSALGTPKHPHPFASPMRPRVPAAPFGMAPNSAQKRSSFGFAPPGGGGGVVLGQSTQAARLSLLNSSSPLSKTVLAPAPLISRQPFQNKPFQAEDRQLFQSEDSPRHKRPFNQVAQSPTQRQADMSLSELRMPARQEESEDDEDNDDDVVLNSSRAPRYALRRQEKVVEEEKMESEPIVTMSSGLPGAFPEEEEEQEPPPRLTRARTRASVEPTSQPAPARKSATSKRTAGKKPITEDPEPEPVRRSSRANSKTTSPDRKKPRSSAEPESSTSVARRSSRSVKEKEKAPPVKKKAGRKGLSAVEE